MAYVLETSEVSLGGEDYTDQARDIALTVQVEEKDVTTFVALGAKEVIGGQLSGSLKVKFNQLAEDNGLDEAMWDAMLAREPIAFVTKVASGTVSATNPSFSGYVLVNKWVPLSGAPGDVAEVEVEFPTSGPVTRNVS
jgi:hypothetical protein